MILISVAMALAAICVVCGLAVAALLIFTVARGRAVSVAASGCTLKGRVYGAGTPGRLRPAVLFLSGWSPGGPPVTWSDFLASRVARRLNLTSLTVRLRGMGSPGTIAELTRADFASDCEAAFDFLSGLARVDPARVAVVGESFGSYMACVVSKQRAVHALALRVPTDFPAEGFANRPQVEFAVFKSREWKRQPHHYSESVSLNALHEFRGNVLIVSSERDQFVPMQTTDNYRAAISDPTKLEYHVMEKASHALNPVTFLQYAHLLEHWLSTHL